MRRETLSSLKARHQSFRLVSDIFHDRGLDVMSLECSRCGDHIDADRSDWFGVARCPACGTENRFPLYALSRIRETWPDRRPVPRTESLPPAPPFADTGYLPEPDMPASDVTWQQALAAVSAGAILLALFGAAVWYFAW